MNFFSSLRTAFIGFVLLAGFSATGAHAQTAAYPSKPIRAIVPFAPGSATDQIGRAFAQKMQDVLGQPVVVENKAGVNGMLGAADVAKATNDGYTILFGTNSTNAALKSLMKSLPYDQDKAFAPIAFMGQVPLIVAVNLKQPVKDLKEFVALAKAKPGEIPFAYASASQQVSTELFMSMAGIKLNPVPYKAGPAAMTDLIGGQVALFTADLAVTLPQVKSGAIRGLAVTSTKRSKAIPELPTVNEAMGWKDYELIAWFGAYAPAGTPADIIAKLNNAVNSAANSKDIIEKFSALGFETDPGTPAAFAQRTTLEAAKWAKTIRDAKIEPQ